MHMRTARFVAVKQLPEKLSVKQGRAFLREVQACLTAERPRVVLDCSKVRQLDSAGIQVLLRCLEEAMKRNGDVKLAAMPPAAAAILELTRVDRLFEAFDSTTDAVNSFHQLSIEPFHSARAHDDLAVAPAMPSDGFEDDPSDSRERPPVSRVTMRTSGGWLRRQIAGCLLLLLVAPLAHAARFPQQEANPGQQGGGASSAPAQSQDADSGAGKANTQPSSSAALPDSPGTVPSPDRLSSAQQLSPKLQTGTQEPLGTAAAPSIKTTGVAASRPAGAAIAPAKQKRARSILIKVGAIVGAGVAVGAVVALSSGSPSRPPGSH
jgi:anti-anti-sigma factor